MKYALWKYPVHLLAYGFGTGLIPFAPGTFGSLVGVALFLFVAPLGPLPYAGLVVALFLAGIFICGQTARDIGAIDPGAIVFDEIVGFLVAMFMVPADWRWVVAGFVLFRLFDIFKPYPINLVEKKLGLGAGIMTDDLIAGIYSLVILQLAHLVTQRFVG